MWKRMTSDLYSNISVADYKFYGKSLIPAE